MKIEVGDIQKQAKRKKPTYHLRQRHGGYAVWVFPVSEHRKIYCVEIPERGYTVYPSARALFRWVFGRECHITEAGYFGSGARGVSPEWDVVRIFSPEGVDLSKRSTEVAKILFAKFGRQIQASGWAPDEILQEVYKGILVRNGGSPWDARKSTFGHYVYMVCQCILANYRKREARKMGREVEIPDDVPVVDVRHREATESFLQYMRGKGARPWLCEIVPMLEAGYTQEQIVRETRRTRSKVADGVKRIQKAAREWAREYGV